MIPIKWEWQIDKIEEWTTRVNELHHSGGSDVMAHEVLKNYVRMLDNQTFEFQMFRTARRIGWEKAMAKVSKKPNRMPDMIQFRLTAQEKRQFQEWEAKNKWDWQSVVEDMTKTDYKVSVSYSSGQRLFYVSFTGREESLNDNRVLTSFAGNIETAMAVNLFKHHVLFESGEWSEREDIGTDDFG